MLVDTSNAVKIKDKKTGATKEAADSNVGKHLTIYTTSGNTKAGFAPFAIGFTLGFLVHRHIYLQLPLTTSLMTFSFQGLIGGSVSGGAFNPARAFGPALFSGKWSHHWIYWIGDFIGAGLAGWAQHFFAHEAVQHSGASAKTKKGGEEENRREALQEEAH